VTKNTWAPALVVAGAVAVVGCGNATPTVQGGDPLRTVDPCVPDGGNSGNRWQDLYACYFGPTGSASCGSMDGCHGARDQKGTTSTGFLCAPTSNPTPCWRSLRLTSAAGQSPIFPDGGDPKTSLFWLGLRKGGSDATKVFNNMPLNSSYVFQAEDLARINAWIQAGAPND
jgi:hypothetical protein